MRKLLTALLFFPALASAGTWKLITDSSSGSRLLVDVDTVKIEKYKKSPKDGTRVYAVMEMMIGGEEHLFTAVIDADDCLGPQRGGALINIYVNKTTDQYFWSDDGNKMYDAQGQWLCSYLKGALKAYQDQRAKGKNLL